MDPLYVALERYYSYSSPLSLRGEIIRDVLQKRGVLAALATGGGYPAPAP